MGTFHQETSFGRTTSLHHDCILWLRSSPRSQVRNLLGLLFDARNVHQSLGTILDIVDFTVTRPKCYDNFDYFDSSALFASRDGYTFTTQGPVSSQTRWKRSFETIESLHRPFPSPGAGSKPADVVFLPAPLFRTPEKLSLEGLMLQICLMSSNPMFTKNHSRNFKGCGARHAAIQINGAAPTLQGLVAKRF